jgi:hypothetical protein
MFDLLEDVELREAIVALDARIAGGGRIEALQAGVGVTEPVLQKWRRELGM